MRNKKAWIWIFTALILSACGPSEKQKAEWAQKKRIECLDATCEGDVWPKHDPSKETVLKINGQWFIGPREYFGSASNAASFEWWSGKPLRPSQPRPANVQKLAEAGYGEQFSISILLRSNNIPLEPYGYRLIQLAEKKNWIAARKNLRPGLDAITMKHVAGPHGQYFDHVTYYIATELKGVDGLPPVAGCNHEDARNGGGSGFMWQPGIWVGIRMNQRHCADWPEIYQETIRVLQKLRRN